MVWRFVRRIGQSRLQSLRWSLRLSTHDLDPGLQYDETVIGGVGVVVQNKAIIGRMMYGTRACECQLLERVDIE